MCFDVLPLAPPGGPSTSDQGDEDEDDDDDISPMNMDGTDAKPSNFENICAHGTVAIPEVSYVTLNLRGI